MSTVVELTNAIGALLTQVDADLGARDQQIAALTARVADLERQLSSIVQPPVEPPPVEPVPVEPPPPVCPVHTVSSVTALLTAAKLPGVKTIRASTSLGGVNLTGLKDIVLDGITFISGTITVSSASNVTIQGCQFIGSGTHYTERKAIAGNSDTLGLKVDRCVFKGVAYAYSGNGRDIKFLRNRASGLGGDFLQFGSGTHGLEIAWNYVTDWVDVSGAHRDYIQFGTWNTNTTGISNVHIHHNVGFKGKGASFQFIYLGNENSRPFVKFLVEHNLGHATHAHGITIKGCTETIVRNNTVLHTAPTSTLGTWIDVSDGNTVQNNIANIVDAGNGNIQTPKLPYSEVFENFRPGVYTLENFRTKTGITAGADVTSLSL